MNSSCPGEHIKAGVKDNSKLRANCHDQHFVNNFTASLKFLVFLKIERTDAMLDIDVKDDHT
jgi:hypothetical protein